LHKPPLHAHVVPAAQLCVQFPPEQFVLHLEPAAHVCVHELPEQLTVQLASFSQVCLHVPPAQLKLHVLPAGQVCVHPPFVQASSMSTVPELLPGSPDDVAPDVPLDPVVSDEHAPASATTSPPAIPTMMRFM
jgi:hypothetical protein